MIGTKVKLTKKYAQWYLDNPDIFFNAKGDCHGAYDVVMQMSMLTLLGQDVVGTVVKKGASEKGLYENWGVEFKTPFGYEFAYYEMHEGIVKV